MSEKVDKPRSRSIFWPLFLIFVGVYLILRNFNLAPGDPWELLLRFWPIIFIGGALDDLVNGKWISGLIVLGFGTLMLLGNLGYFALTGWALLLQFWPVFIIAWGLQLVLKEFSPWGDLIGAVLAIGIIGGMLWFTALNNPVLPGSMTPVEQSLEDVKLAQLEVNSAFTDLQIGSGAQPENLFNGEFALAKNEEIQSDYSKSNDVAKISIDTSNRQSTTAFGWVTTAHPWKLMLNQKIPFEITVDQALGLQNYDFTNLDIERINSNLAMGETTVQLSKDDLFSGSIENAVGMITLKVPEGTPLVLDLDTGLTVIRLPEGYIRTGDHVESPAANDTNPVEIKLSLPVGMLTIETVK